MNNRSRKFLKITGAVLVLMAIIFLIFQTKDYFWNHKVAAPVKDDFLAEVNKKHKDHNEERPNILIIMADDMGYGDLECYGSTAINTPHINALAEEGVKLTNFYSCSALCTPARVGLVTGRYPVRTGLYDALGPTPFDKAQGLLFGTKTGLPQDEITSGSVLKAGGYQTAFIGKWHMGAKSPAWPNDHGFDFFYGSRWSNDFNPFAIYRNYEVEIPAPVDQGMLTQNHTREAVNFINDNKDKPFFLLFAPNAPHTPLEASADFEGISDGGTYGDVVEELDWGVGEIMKTLREHELDEDTLVVFLSDNGPSWEGSPGGLRGRKRDVMEGGFRVPFIARWPGIIPADTVSDEIGIIMDLYNTVLNVAGLPVPDDRIIDGRDILPMLKGEEKSPHEAIYFYFRDDLWAVRWENFKYHKRHQLAEVDAAPILPFNVQKGPFLFNLETDPDESFCVNNKYPDIAQRLAGIMEEMNENVKDNPRGWK